MGPQIIPIIGLVVAAVGGAAQYMSQNQAAKAEADRQSQMAYAQQRANEESTRAALREASLQSDAEAVSLMQEKDAASRELSQVYLENLEARGTALASIGNASYNVELLQQDYERQMGQRFDDVNFALQQKRVASAFTQEGIYQRADQRIRSQSGYIGGVVERPSALGAAFGIVGNGLSAYYSASRGSFS